MTDEKKEKARKDEERRKSERFAWLGPLMERRKAKAEPIKDPEDVQESEEID